MYQLGLFAEWLILVLLLTGSITFMGLPIYIAMHALGLRFTPVFAVSWGAGLCLLFLVSYYGSRLGISLGPLFLLSLGLALLSLVGMTAFWRERLLVIIKPILEEFIVTWGVFAGFSVLLTLFMVSLLDQDQFPFLTLGNNDIFYYSKFSDYLLFGASAEGNIVGYPLARITRQDAFGAFTLLGDASYISFWSAIRPIQATPVPMVMGIAMIGISATTICLTTLKLPRPISYSCGLLAISVPLFWYATLNYFLAQLLCAAFLFTLISILFATSISSALRPLHIAAVSPLFFLPILVTYPVMFYPSFLVLAACAMLLSFAEDPQPRTLFRAALGAVMVAAVTFAAVFVLAPDYVRVAVDIQLHRSQKGIAGWPLHMISPASLAGAPMPWQGLNSRIGFIFEAAALGLVALITTILLYNSRVSSRDFAMKASPVILFCLLLAAYAVALAHYGTSYQQWKFAASYPLMLGYTVIASLAAALILLPAPAWRKYTSTVSLLVIGLLASLNIVASAQLWGSHLFHVPDSIRAVSEIDKLTNITKVFIGLPARERWLAAALIRQTPLYMSENNLDASGSSPVLRKGPTCREADAYPRSLGADYFLSSQSLPSMKPGAKLSFNQTIDACLDMTGVSGREPWGRWTDGNEATFTFVCACPWNDSRLAAVLSFRPYLPRQSDSGQRVIATVNGRPAGEWTFGPGPHTLRLPLSGAAPPDNRVEITLQLPDAISPTVKGSADKRVLGLAMTEFSIVD